LAWVTRNQDVEVLAEIGAAPLLGSPEQIAQAAHLFRN
jgi:hypothetical protein